MNLFHNVVVILRRELWLFGWLGGSVVMASALRSRGHEFDSWLVRYRVTTLGSCSHPCASITKQYSLVPAKGQWRCSAGKVTIGLASHWPCVRDYGPNGFDWDMSTPSMHYFDVVNCRTWTCIMLRLIRRLWLERPTWTKSLVKSVLTNHSELLVTQHLGFRDIFCLFVCQMLLLCISVYC